MAWATLASTAVHADPFQPDIHGSQEISRHRRSFAGCVNPGQRCGRSIQCRRAIQHSNAWTQARPAQHCRHDLRRSRLWRPGLLWVEAGNAQYRSPRCPGSAFYPSLHTHRVMLGFARGIDDRALSHACRRYRRLRSTERHRYVTRCHDCLERAAKGWIRQPCNWQMASRRSSPVRTHAARL